MADSGKLRIISFVPTLNAGEANTGVMVSRLTLSVSAMITLALAGSARVVPRSGKRPHVLTWAHYTAIVLPFPKLCYTFAYQRSNV